MILKIYTFQYEALVDLSYENLNQPYHDIIASTEVKRNEVLFDTFTFVEKNFNMKKLTHIN